MRIHTFHEKSTEAKLGDGMQPKRNQVGVHMVVEGSGAVTASVQPKGRIRSPDSEVLIPLENLGTVISFSGTAPVSQLITMDNLGASEIYIDLLSIGSSLMSFSAFGAEAEE
jgi:hypothetical protein